MKRFYNWIKKLVAYIIGQNIPVYASHASFFIVLSVFPTLVLLLGLVRYTGLEVENLTELLHGVLPMALMPAAQKLIMNTYQSSTGAVITGLSSIYNVSDDRGYWQTRLYSVLYTFAFLLVLLLTLVLHVFGTTIVELLPVEESPLLQFLENVVDLRFFLLLFVQTVLFTAMFMVLPNKRNRLGDSFPGAVLASSGWLIFSDIYSVYVENFTSMSLIYGSVYAVALSMLWLYCCVSIVFYGGALNYYLMDKGE